MGVFSTPRKMSAQELREKMLLEHSERQANAEMLKAQKLLEAEEAKIQKELEEQDKEQKAQEESNKVLEALEQKHRIAKANRALLEATTTLPKIAKRDIIIRTLFNIVNESLWIDEDVKSSNEMVSEATKVFDDIIQKCDAATGTVFMENMNNSKFLSCVSEIAESCGTAIAERILVEAKETKDIDISFDMTEEEKSHIDDKMAGLGSKELSKEIKKKVLNVIKEEKENGKVKSELFKELDDAGIEDESTSANDDGVAESLVGLPMDEIMESVMTVNSEQKEFERFVDGVRILLKTADLEVLNKNFEKAIDIYNEVLGCVEKIIATYRSQEESQIEYGIHNMTLVIASRMFSIKPGTGRAVKKEIGDNLAAFDSIPRAADQITLYCNSMIKACHNNDVVTETLAELKTRLVKESVNRSLSASIGSSVFESLIIRHTYNIKKSNPVLESGLPMMESEIQNAALMQTILEYTMLETLSTLKVYKFDKESLVKFKSM